jgi:hypothetical protein
MAKLEADSKGKLQKEFDLDTDLDSIDDLPGFATFPTCAAMFEVKDIPEKKDVGDHPAIQFDLTLIEMLELKEENLTIEGEQPPKVGDIQSLTFMLDNAFGVDGMKKFLKPIGEKLGTMKPSQLFPQMKGMKLVVVLRRTYNKERDQHYARIKKVAVA